MRQYLASVPGNGRFSRSQAELGNAFYCQAQLGNHLRSQVQLGNEVKTANMIFSVLWSIMTLTGISIATYALFD